MIILQPDAGGHEANDCITRSVQLPIRTSPFPQCSKVILIFNPAYAQL